MTIKEKIIDGFNQVIENKDEPITFDFNNNTVLLESGLDSLDFAILVAVLQDNLGYDPFSLSEEAYYPKTFGEFITFYEKFEPCKNT